MLKITSRTFLFLGFNLVCVAVLFAQKPKPPIMGWSSWNHFRIKISEQLIREEADAMKNLGMDKFGYNFINIDDGFFGGRDSNGKIFSHPTKFPSGMKAVADYIHSKGFKAGIYSDAGSNTCGSIWDKDSLGLGVGMYGHVQQDCEQFIKEWGYDFLKVDWCGGEKQHLDEETEYTKIIQAARAFNSDLVFNICRWKFPGEWAIKIADSWRMSGDIQSKFSSVLRIIDLNTDLFKYTSPGHYNDMDMLQVGRGMSQDEDKSHFSMWCMLNSPLLAGNDLRTMSKETLELLCNTELIAINQDIAHVQAQRLLKEGDIDVWVKHLKKGKQQAVALLNRSNTEQNYTLDATKLGVSKRRKVRDLWLHKNLGRIGGKKTFTIPAHGIVVIKLS